MSGIVQLSSVHLRLDRKIFSDEGMDTSSGTGAKTVNFVKTFVDVRSIQVTPSGTVERKAVYDYDGSSNPPDQFFDVYIFDADGNLVESDFSWQVRGI
jgi:hypothetical protein